jgi:hypothetical protein
VSKSTQFQPGHAPTSPGNPLAGQAAKLRAALFECATPADFKRLGKKLLAAAERGLDDGEVKAVVELFDRLIGRSVTPVEVEAGESLADVLKRIAAQPGLVQP